MTAKAASCLPGDAPGARLSTESGWVISAQPTSVISGPGLKASEEDSSSHTML